MKKIVINNDNRRFNISSIVVGYLEENKEEVLEFEIPEKYSEYGKKACFSANGRTFVKNFDNIISNKLTITRDISQFKELDMTIAFFKIENEDEIVARTSILHILIENAIICDDDVKPDEPKIIILDNLIDEVTKLDVLVTKNEKKREEYYQEIQKKVDNGDLNGATFTPSVDTEGNISWTNDKGLTNPTTQNIKGPKGEKGDKGEKGEDGLPININVNGNTYSHTNGTINLPDYPSLDGYATKDELNNKVSSDVINSIVVVDALPEVEEEGVLYLVKEIPTVINLYYQDTEKNYTSSSGINYIFGIDKTITLNGTPSANASTFSNNFTANLSTSKTYKLTLTYDSGDVTVNSSLAYAIYFYSGGANTGHETLLQIESNDKNGVNGTFTPTIDGEYEYGLRIYVYANNVYDNLKFNVLIEEV